MSPRKIRLQSSELIHTPGILAWAQTTFKSRYRKEREIALEMLTSGFGLPRFVAWGILDGCIPVTVEGKCVTFEVDTKPNVENEAEPRGEIRADELCGLLERWDEGDREYVAQYLADASPAIVAQFTKDLTNYDRGRNLSDCTHPGSVDLFIHLLEGR